VKAGGIAARDISSISGLIANMATPSAARYENRRTAWRVATAS